jgi:hypothetical protein
MTFESRPPEADQSDFRREDAERRWKEAAQQSRRDFTLGGVPVTCWQSTRDSRSDSERDGSNGDPQWWQIACMTAGRARRPTLYARFEGRQEAISEFYSIVKRVTPIE